jgi:ActR/RegA family two-component response regulator
MLRSLLVSRDEKTVHIVGRVFKDLEVAFEHCPDTTIALEKLTGQRYDAIVLDDSIEEAAGVLEKVLQLPSCSKAVRIVLAEPVTALQAVFKTGTQVILYKPLSAERVKHGLRAVRNLMARDRRRGSSRMPTTLPARIRHGKGAGTQVFIADISDSGAAIHCSSGSLPYSGNLHVDFLLPGDSDHIHVTAELVWQNNDGAAGIRFLDMASYARKKLTQWLKEEAIGRKAAVTGAST